MPLEDAATLVANIATRELRVKLLPFAFAGSLVVGHVLTDSRDWAHGELFVSDTDVPRGASSTVGIGRVYAHDCGGCNGDRCSGDFQRGEHDCLLCVAGW